MTEQRLFKRDFTLVVVGQIVSLFGNAVLRFALPLYLLNQTQSAALFGIVSAISFIPMIVLSPIGGIIADRVNKRNVMVILDFSTAGLTLMFTLLLGNVDLVVLIITTLIILYGIQGAYQPTVQASVPALIPPEQLVQANSVVTLVTSLSGLIGPVIGGAVYGFYGISPVLIVSIGCFFASAIMEIFIHIPYQKKLNSGSLLHIVKSDVKESVAFIRHEKPIIAEVALLISAINLVFSALLIIGLPVIITQKLGFSQQLGNQLYGYCEGVMAAGGLVGGVLSGVLAKKFSISRSHIYLAICAFSLLPIGFAMLVGLPSMATYLIILACCLLTMTTSTIFSIQLITYVQIITPQDLVGKIMSVAICMGMCATPIGQALYGWFFDAVSDKFYMIFFAAAVVSCAIALVSRKSFKNL